MTETTQQDLATIRPEAQAETAFVCETCAEPIRDGDEYVTWGDDVRTHRRCAEDDARRGEGGGE